MEETKQSFSLSLFVVTVRTLFYNSGGNPPSSGYVWHGYCVDERLEKGVPVFAAGWCTNNLVFEALREQQWEYHLYWIFYKEQSMLIWIRPALCSSNYLLRSSVTPWGFLITLIFPKNSWHELLEVQMEAIFCVGIAAGDGHTVGGREHVLKIKFICGL